MGGGIGLTACNERLSLPLLHAHEPECMPERLPSAQPRFLSPALETHAQEVSASPLAATLSKEHAQSWVGASVSPLAMSASRCHCCMHTSLSACLSACHQLSHAPLSPALETDAQERQCVTSHDAASRRACSVMGGVHFAPHRLQRAPPAAIAASTRARRVLDASHQLSHASSRQHLKLMRKRSVRHHSRRPCQKSMLSHGWGHRSHRLQ